MESNLTQEAIQWFEVLRDEIIACPVHRKWKVSVRKPLQYSRLSWTQVKVRGWRDLVIDEVCVLEEPVMTSVIFT